MYRHPESNPHFLPRHNDSVIEIPSQTSPHVPPRPHDPVIEFPTQPPRPHHHSRMSEEPPPHGARPQPHVKPLPRHQVERPPQPPRQESRPHFASGPADSQPPSGRGQHPAQHGHAGHRRRPSLIAPPSRPTKPLAWLVAAFCALFWIIIIVGGLIILIVYLVFRPRNPRFDISTATINAAYLDMGYLLNADVTVLANFTNPNTKVNVDFSYIVLDLYYDNVIISSHYVEPFSVMKSESRFAAVHMVGSQVRLSMGQSVELQRQIGEGRVNFEIKGLFRARSKLGGIFQYTYWLNAQCQIVVTGPPTGVLIRKRCVTKR